MVDFMEIPDNETWRLILDDCLINVNILCIAYLFHVTLLH